MAKIKVDEVNVTATLDDVQVDATVPNADITTKQSITAEVEPDNYVLASQGYSSGVPGWVSSKVSELIQDSIGNGDTLAEALDKIKTDLMDQIQLGVNQAISEVENAYVSQSALTTTLASEIGASRAAILDSVQTYADDTQSVASEVNALKASFGNDISADAINAFIGNIALTKATSKEAFASTVNTLTASYNGLEPRIESTETVVAGQFKEYSVNGVVSIDPDTGVQWSEPKVGMYKIADGSYWNYVGGTLGENNDGWIRTDRGALDAVSNLQLTTTSNVSALQSQIDGNIATWFYNYGTDANGNVLAPTLNDLPAKNWVDTDTANGNDIEKTNHLGDITYDKDSGYGYRFSYKDLPNDTPDAGVIWSWILIKDTAITKALHDASLAQDTADHKRMIFTGATPPTDVTTADGNTLVLSDGDMWIPDVGATDYLVGKIYTYKNGWHLASKEFVTVMSDDFEDGIANWSATTDNTLTLETSDVYSGSNAALMTSTQTNADSGGLVSGVHTKVIDNGLVTAGITVEITVKAKQPSTNGSSQFAMSYSTDSVGNSGWHTFNLTNIWTTYSFTFNVPSDNVNNDYLGIWADTSASGKGVLIDNVKVKTLVDSSADAFANAINPKVDLLREQTDHKIEYYFIESTDIDPKNSWTTQTIKNEHNGDILYYTDLNKAYRYYSVDGTWHEDKTLVKALSDAAKAKETADHKLTRFYGTLSERDDETTMEQGDQWTDSATQETYVYDNTNTWVPLNKRQGVLKNAPYNNNVGPAGASINDIWVITNRWYAEPYDNSNKKALTSDSTYTDANGSKHKLKQAIEIYDGKKWVLQDYDSKESKQISWVGVASKLLYAPDGGLTGWQFEDGGGSPSEFKINAQKFIISDGQGNGANVPFSIDSSTGTNKIKFTGIVDFTNSDMSNYNNNNIIIPKPGTNIMNAAYSIFSNSNHPHVTIGGSTNGLAWRDDALWTNKGTNSLMIGADATDSYVILASSNSDYNVEVPTNADIIISAYLKVSAGNGNTQIYAIFPDSGNNPPNNSTTIPVNTWTRVHFKVNTGNNTAMNVRLDNDGYTNSRTNMAIDAVMVEIASSGQTKPSEFSLPVAGLAHKDMSNVTSIDGGKITTGTLRANQLFSNRLVNVSAYNSNGTINESKVTMDVNLGNGSIYIA